MTEVASSISQRAIIGCSPSSGSSLLRRVLNRHSEIYCGEESHLFCKSGLYDDWEYYKNKLFRRSIFGLRSEGWHNLTGVYLSGPESLWDQNELVSLRNRSNSFHEFADQYFYLMLKENGKQTYIEKTPSNIFVFSRFIDEFNGKCIFIYRNPLDTIASMILRGNSIYKAVCTCLLHNSFGIATIGAKQHYSLSYEDLVLEPKSTMLKLCQFIGVEYEEKMLESNQGVVGSVSKMKGWNYDETESIGTKSLDRFNQLDDSQKTKVAYAISSIRIKDNYATKHNLSVQNIEQLIKKLNYKSDIKALNKKSIFLKRHLFIDKLERTLKLYPSHIFNYPIELIDVK